MSSATATELAKAPTAAFAQVEQAGVELLPLRKAGLARFAEHGYPTTRDEDWRFTSLKPFTELPFQPVLEPLGQAAIDGITFAQHDTDRLIFVDGHFAEELSRVSEQPDGVTVSNLAGRLSGLENEIGSLSGSDENPLIALNDAFFTDGALIRIPANQRLTKPVHLVYLSTASEDGQVAHVRNWIEAGANAQGTIIESHLSLGQAAASTIVVTETRVGSGANLEHIKFQDQSDSTIHLASLHSELSNDARYAFHSFALGARLSRTNLRMR